MARWTIDRPTTQTIDGIVALRVRILGGQVNIIPTDDPVTFEVTDIVGEPLLAVQEAGILTIHYEDLTGSGLLERLRPVQLGGYKQMRRRSATVNLRVPRDCPVEVATMSAPIVVAGVGSRTRLKTASGEITLDGTGGETDVNTVSGNASLRGVEGGLTFNSVSGQLAVAGGRVASLSAKTVSGSVLADTDVAPAGRVRLNTVSGEIALRVPADTSASVEIRTATATVDSDFGLERSGGRARTVLSGRIGGGVDPATITINSASGRTALLRRAPETPAAIPEGA
ncbi:DUF4097 family beta strand repeat-containing protein [Nocardiopsis sp. N85]|uniref:DUF4097 family beta strand repeat-containing protein n=1 Tax=Nocardiopsis sp. N85 TaxID=3029400 RepID=UPI00237F15D1|nr:DUF4097 family beta strand repeat-containing protein [Nocardiopsis sp. N85]MDE3720954.1 DUF4097 family beta strand repeat-containing protein [Nocardiopsis sp. N85]